MNPGLFVAVALLVPATAHAIPTPDAIVGGGAALGWLAGALAAALGVTATGVRGLRRSAGRAAAVSVLVAGVLVGTLYLLANPSPRAARMAESEYQCDFGYHLARNQADAALQQLRAHPGYQRNSIDTVAAPAPGVSVLAIDTRLPWWFASGHLGWPSSGIEAEHVWPSELSTRLEQWLSSTPQGVPRQLVWTTYRTNPLLELTAEQQELALSLLAQIDRIDHFVLNAASAEPADPAVALLLGAPTHRIAGEALAVAEPRRITRWPIVEEGFLFDAEAVWFEGAERRLDGIQLARTLRRDGVHIVVPFASYYRPASTWIPEFVASYLSAQDPERIHVLDHSDEDIRRAIEETIAAIGDNPFVVVGGSKFDTMHYGLSFAWQAAMQRPGATFLGHSAELALAAAYLGEHDSRWTRGVPQRWQEAAWMQLATRAGSPERIPLVLGMGGALVGLALTPLLLVGLFGRARDLQVDAEIRAACELDRRAIAAVASAARTAMRPHPAVVALAALAALAVTATAGALAAAATTRLGVPAKPDAVATLVAAGAFAMPELLYRRMTHAPWRASLLWSALPAATLAAVLPAYPPAIAQLLAGLAVVRAALAAIPYLLLRPRTAATQVDAGGKATRLAALAAERIPGVATPRSIVVPTVEALNGTLPGLPPGRRWAVRSSAAGEDGAETSQAGRYRTELDVRSDELRDACARVAGSYGDRRGCVLIQPMIPARLEAVCFTSDPMTPALLSIATSFETGGALVAGRAAEQVTWRLSRLTGRWYPAPSPQMQRVLDRIAWSALCIARRSGHPQDVEAVVPAGTDLPVTVQARPATTPHAASADEDRAALKTLLASDPAVVLRPSPVAVALGPIDSASLDLLVRMHASDGARGEGAQLLGTGRPTSGDLVMLDGALLETESRPTLRERMLLRRLLGSLERKPAESLRRVETMLRESLDTLQRIGGAPGADRTELLAAVATSVLPGVYAAISWSEYAAATTPSGPVPVPAGWLGSLSGAQMIRDRRELDPGVFLERWGHRGDYDWNPSARRVRDGWLQAEANAPLASPAPGDHTDHTWLSVAASVREAAHDIGARAMALLSEGMERRASPGHREVSSATDGVLRPVEIDQRWLRRASTAWVSAPRDFSGRAWLAESPESLPPSAGVVLVTSHLEPRWLPAAMLPGVTGWIADRGNVLSHAAIVAREFGLAVLVARTSGLHTGDAVDVSRSGAVRRISDDSSACAGTQGEEGSAAPLASPGSGSAGSFSSPTRA